jgi:hypothetical protein
MPRDIDVLAAPTLKNLRTRWWDDAFTTFVRDTVQPRPGRRILDIGCGIGTAEVNLGRQPLTQVTLVGVDRAPDRVREALAAVRSHNIRAAFAARYFYSSSKAGMRAYELAGQFFSGLSERSDATDPAVGPKLPALFANSGIQLLDVQLFPVSRAQLGGPPPAVWASRRQAIEKAIAAAGDVGLRRLGQDYLKLLDSYAEEARAAGPAFVELQNTMLFATVGQRQE